MFLWFHSFGIITFCGDSASPLFINLSYPSSLLHKVQDCHQGSLIYRNISIYSNEKKSQEKNDIGKVISHFFNLGKITSFALLVPCPCEATDIVNSFLEGAIMQYSIITRQDVSLHSREWIKKISTWQLNRLNEIRDIL